MMYCTCEVFYVMLGILVFVQCLHIFMWCYGIFINIYLENGSWAAWSNYTTCNAACGAGTQTRYRNCTNPPPYGNGTLCESTQLVDLFGFVQNITSQTSVDTDEISCTITPCPSKLIFLVIESYHVFCLASCLKSRSEIQNHKHFKS